MQHVNHIVFERKRIIRALQGYDTRIFEHAVKIIVLPDNQDVQHWKAELIGWCGFLSSLRNKTKGTPPMGYALAYKYLYDGPFVGNELGMTKHFIQLVELKYRREIEVDVNIVHDKLKSFLTKISEKIGLGESVEETIMQL